MTWVGLFWLKKLQCSSKLKTKFKRKKKKRERERTKQEEKVIIPMDEIFEWLLICGSRDGRRDEALFEGLRGEGRGGRERERGDEEKWRTKISVSGGELAVY